MFILKLSALKLAFIIRFFDRSRRSVLKYCIGRRDGFETFGGKLNELIGDSHDASRKMQDGLTLSGLIHLLFFCFTIAPRNIPGHARFGERPRARARRRA